MKLLRKFYAETRRMLQVSAALLLPFALLYGYMRMNVETALLKRRIAAAAQERDDLARRNRSLRNALAGLAAEAGEDPLRWKTYDTIPLFEQNKIVRIRLPDSLPGDRAP